jgi:hypothetical protein
VIPWIDHWPLGWPAWPSTGRVRLAWPSAGSVEHLPRSNRSIALFSHRRVLMYALVFIFWPVSKKRCQQSGISIFYQFI